MNKKANIFLGLAIIIFIIAIAFYYQGIRTNKKDGSGCFVNKGESWCELKGKCIDKGESCGLTADWILGEAKKILGMNLNIMPNETIKWNAKDGKESAFSSKGVYYLDAYKSEKVLKGFSDINKFLQDIGMKTDESNPPINAEKEKTVKYAKDSIICALSQSNNGASSSSISLFCGNEGEILCSFNSDCGRDCETDSDCALITNGCEKKTVCRNKTGKFYNDCLNPTANVDLLDLDINECSCVENKCQPTREKYRNKN